MQRNHWQTLKSSVSFARTKVKKIGKVVGEFHVHHFFVCLTEQLKCALVAKQILNVSIFGLHTLHSPDGITVCVIIPTSTRGRQHSVPFRAFSIFGESSDVTAFGWVSNCRVNCMQAAFYRKQHLCMRMGQAKERVCMVFNTWLQSKENGVEGIKLRI
jgi:hypothetical protein